MHPDGTPLADEELPSSRALRLEAVINTEVVIERRRGGVRDPGARERCTRPFRIRGQARRGGHLPGHHRAEAAPASQSGFHGPGGARFADPAAVGAAAARGSPATRRGRRGARPDPDAACDEAAW